MWGAWGWKSPGRERGDAEHNGSKPKAENKMEEDTLDLSHEAEKQ